MVWKRSSLLMLGLLLGCAAALRAGELVVMLQAAPKTLHPALVTAAAGVRISHQLIFDTLLVQDEQLRVRGGLAQRWQRLTPRRYRFEIKTGVRFHDGSPLDARDVVYTLESLMDVRQASPYGALLREKIAAVKAKAPHVVEVTLKAPFAAFPADLILPVRSRAATPETALVGSGPFRFVERSVNEILLARNADYHGPKPALTGVRFKVVRDETTRLLKMRKGGIDLAINVIPLEKLSRFRRGKLKQRYQLLEAPGLSYQYLGFNLKHPILSRKRVRQAIAHAIDADALIAYRQRGHSTRATGLLPPASPYALSNAQPRRHDPALAERLLEQAGLPRSGEGVRFGLTYKTSTDRAAVIQARIIKEDLRKVGIAVEVRAYEWGTFYEDIGKGNFEMFSLRWIGVSDPDFYHELFHSSRVPPRGRNRGRFAHPRVDALLEAGRLEGDADKRRGIYQELQRILHEELPYIPLWHNNNVAVLSRRYAGFRLHPSGGFEHLPALYPRQP